MIRVILTYLIILIATFVHAQSGLQYKPKVAWKTVVDSVGFVSTDVYIVKVEPIDYNDPGAIQRITSGYLMDNVGHIFTISDSTSTTITVLDEFGYGIAPVSGKIGWVYQSVGDGYAPYIAPVMYEPLDSKAKDNADKLFKDILWRKGVTKEYVDSKISDEAYGSTWSGQDTIGASKNALYNIISTFEHIQYCPTSMTVNRGTLNAGTAADLCEVGGTDVNISELNGPDPLRVTFTFTNVERFDGISFFGDYNGGANHVVAVEIYNYNTSQWDFKGQFSSTPDKQWYGWAVFTPNSYLSSGTVQVRFAHLDNGVTAHNLILDYIDIHYGGGGAGSAIGASSVTFNPSGNISSTNVQGAIMELDAISHSHANKALLDAIKASDTTRWAIQYTDGQAVTANSGLYLGIGGLTSDTGKPAFIDNVNSLRNTAAWAGTGSTNRPLDVNSAVFSVVPLISQPYGFQLGAREENLTFRGLENGTWGNWRKIYHEGNFTDNSANWNTAFGWNNHSGNYVALDPVGIYASASLLRVIDLNTVNVTSNFYAGSGSVNTPPPTGYGFVNSNIFGTAGAQTVINQLAEDRFYYRKLLNGTWGSWYQVASTDWVTAQNYQTALTNPITGTGTVDRLAKFNALSGLTDSKLIDEASGVSSTGYLGVATANSGLITTTTKPLLYGITSGDVVLQPADEAPIRLVTRTGGSVTTKLIVTATGNVGIGENVPTSPLTVSAGSNTRGIKLYRGVTTNGSASGIGFNLLNSSSVDTEYAYIVSRIVANTAGAESGSLGFVTRNAGTSTEHIRLLQNGNFGIGTTSPSSKLHVLGTVDIQSGNALGTIILGANLGSSSRSASSRKFANIVTPNFANALNWEWLSVDAPSSTINRLSLGGRSGASSTGGATEIVFSTNTSTTTAGATQRMVITSTGDVGIGVTPAQKLHVGGTVRLTPLTTSTTTVLGLDSNGDITTNVSITGGVNWLGGWNASTNTPTISDATGSNGDWYKVTVGATRNLGSGNITFEVGDDIIHNGTVWQKFSAEITETDPEVRKVVGIVKADGTDIFAATENVDYQTPLESGVDYQTPIANGTGFLKNDGSGAWSYDNSTYISNALPSTQIIVGDGDGIAQARTLSLNATSGTFGLSNTGVLTMPNASGSARGLLSSTDWTTFNNKQSTIIAGEGLVFSATTLNLALQELTPGTLSTNLHFIPWVNSTNNLHYRVGLTDLQGVVGWDAGKLQGRTVSSTAPTTNQILQWNGSQWTPSTISTSGITGSGTANYLAVFDGSTSLTTGGTYVDNGILRHTQSSSALPAMIVQNINASGGGLEVYSSGASAFRIFDHSGGTQRFRFQGNGLMYATAIGSATTSNVLYYDTNDGRITYGVAPTGGGGGVTSFNSRTGVVTSTTGDYTASMVTNAAAVNVQNTFTANQLIEKSTPYYSVYNTLASSAGGGLEVLNESGTRVVTMGYNNSLDHIYIWGEANNPIKFGINATERVRFTPSNTVEIVNAASSTPTVQTGFGAFYSFNGTPYFRYGANTPIALTGGGGGSTTFLGLTDTPSSYSGSQNYFVRVNSGGTGLEFVAGTLSAHNLTFHDDVTISAPATDKVLAYSTGQWRDRTATEANLADLPSNQTITGIKSFSNITLLKQSDINTASIRIPEGIEPGTLLNGDIWTTSSGVYARINSTTRRLDKLSEVPLATTANANFTLNLATHINAKHSTNAARNITFSNLSEGLTGNIEVIYTGTGIVGFIVPSNYTLYIADNVYLDTINAYNKRVKSRTNGTRAIYSYYVSGTNVYINGTQIYN